MHITPTAQERIEQIKQQLPNEQFTITCELLNHHQWLRLEFGDLFIPVLCPANFNYATATLDYVAPNFVIK